MLLMASRFSALVRTLETEHLSHLREAHAPLAQRMSAAASANHYGPVPARVGRRARPAWLCPPPSNREPAFPKASAIQGRVRAGAFLRAWTFLRSRTRRRKG